MNILKPMKFHPIFKDKIWGGSKIKDILHHDFSPMQSCGELWAISGVEGSESVVSEGLLEGNTLNEVLEIFMGELVGEKVFEKFETQFPILIKYLDANDWLSIQVHPDDELAQIRGLNQGKTEMWYILQADENAQLISGFKKPVSKEQFKQKVENNTVAELLNYEQVAGGDAYYMPSGRVHSLGPGILLAEIQQTSDTTYRIYDWNRKDSEGNSRDLHIEDSLDAINYQVEKNYKVDFQKINNQTIPIVDEQYFTTNILTFDAPIEKDYDELDSFVIYMVTSGSFQLKFDDEVMDLGIGDTILIPAITKKLELYPLPKARILEIYIK
ncbi:MAG: mannose-6-phosphate isomerase [Bacteroidetes bacterium]|nr:MAG: mannose-6-phosphate isomerase [Bacteroidota bacterium]